MRRRRRAGQIRIGVLDDRDDLDDRFQHEEIHQRADDGGDLVAHEDADADADDSEDRDHHEIADHGEQDAVVVQPMGMPLAANQIAMIAAVRAAQQRP